MLTHAKIHDAKSVFGREIAFHKLVPSRSWVNFMTPNQPLELGSIAARMYVLTNTLSNQFTWGRMSKPAWKLSHTSNLLQ